jgi:hypothetical protein
VTTLLLRTLGALLGLVLGLAWLALRTTPGLTLIAFGATTTALGHPLVGLAVAAGGALLYAEQCKRTPYANCLRCNGIGYRPRRARLLRRNDTARRCRHCRGKGVRMRWGRAVMNAYRRATYTGTPTAPARPAEVAPAAPEPEPPTYTDALRRHAIRRH